MGGRGRNGTHFLFFFFFPFLIETEGFRKRGLYNFLVMMSV